MCTLLFSMGRPGIRFHLNMENERQDCICSAFAMPIGNIAVDILFNVADMLKRSGRFGLLLHLRILLVSYSF